MKIGKYSKRFKKYYIFLRRKDLQGGIEHAVYVNGAKKIEILKNFNQIDPISFIQTDNTEIDYLIENKDKIKKCFIYLLLRNCFTDYIENKKKISYLKKYIKHLHVINHFSYKKDNYLHPASQDIKFNKDLFQIKIKGLNLREKIKFFFPNTFTIFKMMLNINLSIQLLRNNYLVFCGKYFFSKEQNKETVKSSKFSKITKKYLDRLEKYRNPQSIKTVEKDLEILEKILRKKKKNYFETFYLIQCFSRTLICNHLRNFHCCKLFYKPTLNLLRTKIFKKTFQIDVNSLVTPGVAIDRYWNIKKYYNRNCLSLLFFEKNYSHSNENFYKNIERIIYFLRHIYKINDFTISAKNLKDKLEFYFNNKKRY